MWYTRIMRIAVTAVLVLIAAVVAWNIWIYYEVAPRTRDGRIRADVVTVAADVAGRVVQVAVEDDQKVAKGDVLFRVDPSRYQIALAEAKATLASAAVKRDQARRDAGRYERLAESVASTQAREQAVTEAAEADAAWQEAKAAVDLAELNLKRTAVRSPVNGTVVNLALKAGEHVAAGAAVMALVDGDSFYAVGYFEETKMSRIEIGDAAIVRVMGEQDVLHGHVVGMSAAITDPERTTNSQLLPTVNPSFTWVRLAQRIPVRIALDEKPANLRLVAGRTVSVDISEGSAAARPASSDERVTSDADVAASASQDAHE